MHCNMLDGVIMPISSINMLFLVLQDNMLDTGKAANIRVLELAQFQSIGIAILALKWNVDLVHL